MKQGRHAWGGHERLSISLPLERGAEIIFNTLERLSISLPSCIHAKEPSSLIAVTLAPTDGAAMGGGEGQQDPAAAPSMRRSERYMLTPAGEARGYYALRSSMLTPVRPQG